VWFGRCVSSSLLRTACLDGVLQAACFGPRVSVACFSRRVAGRVRRRLLRAAGVGTARFERRLLGSDSRHAFCQRCLLGVLEAVKPDNTWAMRKSHQVRKAIILTALTAQRADRRRCELGWLSPQKQITPSRTPALSRTPHPQTSAAPANIHASQIQVPAHRTRSLRLRSTLSAEDTQTSRVTRLTTPTYSKPASTNAHHQSPALHLRVAILHTAPAKPTASAPATNLLAAARVRAPTPKTERVRRHVSHAGMLCSMHAL
jgi:hypothetical protein